MSATTEGVRAEMNINFIFLPPNSTHLLQPLDVAVYGPMKKAWRKVLTEWKEGPGKYYTALPKQWFPSLHFQLLDEMDNRDELAVAGFRATGIYPIDKDHIMRKITNENVESAHDLVSPLVLEHLRQIREFAANKTNATRRGKRVQVEPGKSISLWELGASTSGTSVSRPAKRCASSGRGGRRGKVAKIPVPVDSPSSSDSDENGDDPCEVTVGKDSSDNSNDGGLEVPVGGNKHEQESHGDTSDSDTWNIEEVSVEKHEVEELPEDAFEVEDYVHHSQKLSQPPLLPWVAVQDDGRILSVHCNYMAGLGKAENVEMATRGQATSRLVVQFGVVRHAQEWAKQCIDFLAIHRGKREHWRPNNSFFCSDHFDDG
ncbi:hypothetical protein Pmani_000206 [Petrolisthes manimaculis]|uniref:DDE-1 domain-containing protein n=1 Tax=Petrolisthes manimaculis TaxID=1843537 RepID=A0AAE1UT88_9EUCA|nr:hypothetical protein Pmani_000206 [Petrolisthes manimaculis]